MEGKANREELKKALSHFGINIDDLHIDDKDGELEKALAVVRKHGKGSTPSFANNQLSSEELEKGISNKVTEAVTEVITKSLDEGLGLLKKSITAELEDEGGDIPLLSETIQELQKSMSDLTESFESFLSTPNKRKGFSSNAFMEKSFTGADINDNDKVLSMSKDKRDILLLIDKNSITDPVELEKGVRNEFNLAGVDFETTGRMQANVLARLEKLEDVKIVQ